MTYLFPDLLHYICKEFVNPNAKWGWDLYRDSTPEEIVSEITDKGTNPWWMGWLDMRLVPDGEDEVIVQLFPRYEYFPPEDYDFEELRRVGVSGILKQAFSIRGADKLRPMQLSNALAILECDVEWLIGTKDSSPEERLEGIPENCMKWLDWEVVEFEDGEEILLSLKQQKDSSEE